LIKKIEEYEAFRAKIPDCSHIMCIESITSKIKDKNQCEEIFKDAKINGNNIYKPIAATRRIELRFIRERFLNIYKRLNLVLNIKALQKQSYIKIVIQKINYSKELFVHDL